MKKKLSISLAFIGLFILSSCTQKPAYVRNEGFIFGTVYHVIYQSPNGKDLQQELDELLNEFNHSLSTYDPQSVISKVNQNDSSVVLDNYFITCFKKGEEVSKLTDGAFDMTVAPLVNAWGFGWDHETIPDSAKIDSLMQYVGYQKVKLVNNKIVKSVS